MKLTMNNQKNNKRIAMLVACSFGFSVAFGFAPIGTTSSSALGGSIVEAASAQTASSNLVGHDKKDKKDKKKKKGKKHGKVKKPTKPQQKVKKDGRGKGQKCTAKMLSKAAARSGLSVPAYAYYMGYVIVTEEEYEVYMESSDYEEFELVDDSDIDWDDIDDEDYEDEDDFDYGDEMIYEVKCPTCGEIINIDEVNAEIADLKTRIAEVEKQMAKYLEELGL